MLNKKGPNTEPWETPVVTVCQLDLTPFTTTLCARPFSQFFIQQRVHSSKAWAASFSRRMLWGTVWGCPLQVIGPYMAPGSISRSVFKRTAWEECLLGHWTLPCWRCLRFPCSVPWYIVSTDHSWTFFCRCECSMGSFESCFSSCCMARDICASIISNFTFLIVNLQSFANDHPIYISVSTNLNIYV